MLPLKCCQKCRSEKVMGWEMKTLSKYTKDSLKLIPYLGEFARIRAKAYGTSLFYLEGDNIIEEKPDGTKIVVEKLGKKQ